MTKDLGDLRNRFEWTKDGVDTYRVMNERAGPLKGDCDDFAATALWLACDKSMWEFWKAVFTFQAVFWRVKGEGWASHLVVYYKPLGWIDNGFTKWGPKRDVLRFPVLPPIVAFKMLLGKIKG